jgi:uncharacterized cupin superfamily protein
MKIVNVADVPLERWESPGGKYLSEDKEISVALGRKKDSMNLSERHPFDLDLCILSDGKSMCPYHLHSAQWEFYLIIFGSGTVRNHEGWHPIKEGDAFIFGPGEAHEIRSDKNTSLKMYIIADNPVGESCYYPDSEKWSVLRFGPQRVIIKGDEVPYLEGEEA